MRARPNEDFVSDARHDVRAYDEVLNHLGEADSRRLIPTPALVCDRSILLANIEVMARLARDAGVALRPHVKTHKSAYVAKRQLEAGAVGLSFAKLGEAEVIVDRLRAEVDHPLSVLLTSPLVGRHAADRAAALAASCDLHGVIDHRDGVVRRDGLRRFGADGLGQRGRTAERRTALGPRCGLDVFHQCHVVEPGGQLPDVVLGCCRLELHHHLCEWLDRRGTGRAVHHGLFDLGDLRRDGSGHHAVVLGLRQRRRPDVIVQRADVLDHGHVVEPRGHLPELVSGGG